MAKADESPEELTRQLWALTDYLDEEKQVSQRAIAGKIGLNGDSAISKAKSFSNQQQTFGGRTRAELVQDICRAFGLELKPVLEGGKMGYEVLSLPSATGLETAPGHVFVACSYGVNDRIVYKGVFEMDADWERAEIQYFDYQNKQARTQRGRIYSEGGGLFFIDVPPTREEPTHALFSFLRIIGTNWQNADFFHGVYATANLGNKPVCGEIVFKRVADRQTALAMMGQPAEDFLQFLLHHKQLKVPSTAYVSTDFDTHRQVRLLKQVAGIYVGYFFHHKEEVVYVKSYLHVFPDGRVRFRSRIFSSDLDGVVTVLRNDHDLLLIKLNEHHYSKTMTLRYNAKTTVNAEARLDGVFTGIMGSAPFARRIRFFRLEDQTDLQDLQGDLIPIQNTGGRPDLISFQRFLLGLEQDRFGDDAHHYFSESSSPGMDVADHDRVLLHSENLRAYEGAYEAYVIIYHYPRQVNVLQKLVLRIEFDGEAVLQSDHPRRYQGNFLLSFEQNLLIGQFEFDDQEDDFKFYFHLNSSFRDREQCVLQGVFSGKQPSADLPMAGRILLKRVSSDPGADIRPETYPLSSEECRTIFDQTPGLIDFFLGREDQMIVSYYHLLSDRVIPRTGNVPTEIRRVAGSYLCVKLNASLEGVNINPVCLYPDGRFEMKSTRPGKSFYYGHASLQGGNVLSLFTSWLDDQPFFTHYLFTIGGYNRQEVRYLSGVCTGVSSSSSTRCGRAILIRMEEDFADLRAETLPIPFAPGASDRFRRLDQLYDGALTYLIGDENNLIKATSERVKNFRRDLDYGEIFFSAACFQAARDNPERAREYLQRARIHGFKDRRRLNRELTSGVLSPLRKDIDPDTFL